MQVRAGAVAVLRGESLMVVLGRGSGFDPGAGLGVQSTLAEGRGQHV